MWPLKPSCRGQSTLGTEAAPPACSEDEQTETACLSYQKVPRYRRLVTAQNFLEPKRSYRKKTCTQRSSMGGPTF